MAYQNPNTPRIPPQPPVVVEDDVLAANKERSQPDNQPGKDTSVTAPKKPKEKKQREGAADTPPSPKKDTKPRKNAANDPSCEKPRNSQVNFRMNAEEHRRLKIHCAAIDTNLGDLLCRLAQLEMSGKYRCCNKDCGYEQLALSDDLVPAKCPCCDSKVKLVTD